MNDIATKGAERRETARRELLVTTSARDAIRRYLTAARPPSGRVLVPSYVGWSAREGSGVVDPIVDAGCEPVFYGVDSSLGVDLVALRSLLAQEGGACLLLVHYFGRPDPSYHDIVDSARSHGIPVIEDEAHALLSDLVGGCTGRLGDAAALSIHKSMPIRGGLLAVRSDCVRSAIGIERRGSELWNYDLVAIAQRRRANYEEALTALSGSGSAARALWPALEGDWVPYCFPVLLPRAGLRDDLYHQVNEAGVGLVSLYYALAPSIDLDEFPISAMLSSRLVCLPVHQDTDAVQVRRGVEVLVDALAELTHGDGAC